jgi:WD40 repeat protein
MDTSIRMIGSHQLEGKFKLYSDRFISPWSESKRAKFEITQTPSNTTRDYLDALSQATLGITQPILKEKKELPFRQLKDEPLFLRQLPDLLAHPSYKPFAWSSQLFATLLKDQIFITDFEEKNGKLGVRAGFGIPNDGINIGGKHRVLAFSKNGLAIYIGTKLGAIQTWDLEANKAGSCYGIDGMSGITSIKCLNENIMFAGNSQGKLFFYDCRVGEGLINVINGFENGQSIEAIEFNREVSCIVGGGFGTIKLWDIRKIKTSSNDPIIVYKRFSNESINTLDVCPTNSNLFVAASGNAISLYPVYDSIPKNISQTESFVWGANWSSDGKEIVVSQNKGVQLYRCYSPSRLKKWTELPMEFNEINFFPVLDPTREKLAISTITQDYKLVQIWSVFEKQLPQSSVFDLGVDRRFIIR